MVCVYNTFDKFGMSDNWGEIFGWKSMVGPVYKSIISKLYIVIVSRRKQIFISGIKIYRAALYWHSAIVARQANKIQTRTNFLRILYIFPPEIKKTFHPSFDRKPELIDDGRVHASYDTVVLFTLRPKLLTLGKIWWICPFIFSSFVLMSALQEISISSWGRFLHINLILKIYRWF